MRRTASRDWEWIAFGFVFGPFILVFLILLVPFVLAVEVKAWLARHRIRKEKLARISERTYNDPIWRKDD